MNLIPPMMAMHSVEEGVATVVECEWTDGGDLVAPGGSEYDFGTLDFGDAAADRIIVVVVTGGRTNGSVSIQDCDIGGSSASLAVAQDGQSSASIFYRAVPTGTSGNVTVTSSGANSPLNVRVDVFALYNVETATPGDTDSDVVSSGTGGSISLSTADGGVGIAVGVTSNNASMTSSNMSGIGNGANGQNVAFSTTYSRWRRGFSLTTGATLNVSNPSITGDNNSIVGAAWR